MKIFDKVKKGKFNIGRDATIIFLSVVFIIAIVGISGDMQKRPKPKRQIYQKSSSDSLKSFNLSYQKRREIYINFTEDPSWDLPDGYSKEMDNYRFKKYTKSYNISRAGLLHILTEGLQKGW